MYIKQQLEQDTAFSSDGINLTFSLLFSPRATTARRTATMASNYKSFFIFFIRAGLLLGLANPLLTSASCPSQCRCDGTFIYCNDRDLTYIPSGIPEDATVLFLQNNRIKSAGIPTDLRRLNNVEKIYLYCNNLDEFPTNLPLNVKELHLQENNIRIITHASLAQIPFIEELHLDDNSVSAVSIEEGAFRDSYHLRLLFLSRNHLSTIPPSLPMTIEELRFDDNRISSISEASLQDLINLKRLVLDGNLLNNRGIGEMALVNLVNLTELSLVRNSLTSPPANLPGSSLEKLNLQDNHINHVPAGAFAFLRQLYRLDLSGNNLSSLPMGVFEDLDNLTQLLLRNNPWYCNCRMKWVRDWLRSIPSKVNVRGFMCQGPDKVKGMAIKDLSTELFGCSDTEIPTTYETSTVSNSLPPSRPQWPSYVTKRPVVKGPELGRNYRSTTPSSRKIITISVKSSSAETVHISWRVSQPMTALRLSWLKLGHRPAFGSITETIVQGERTEYLLTALEPESSYRICMVPMETSNIYLSWRDTCLHRDRNWFPETVQSHHNLEQRAGERALQKFQSAFSCYHRRGGGPSGYHQCWLWCAGTSTGTALYFPGTARTTKGADGRTITPKLEQRRTAPSWRLERPRFKWFP